MNAAIQPILEQAIKLTDAERIEIAYRLLDSLPEGIEDADVLSSTFIVELDRRFADDAKSVSLDEVRSLWNASNGRS